LGTFTESDLPRGLARHRVAKGQGCNYSAGPAERLPARRLPAGEPVWRSRESRRQYVSAEAAPRHKSVSRLVVPRRVALKTPQNGTARRARHTTPSKSADACALRRQTGIARHEHNWVIGARRSSKRLVRACAALLKRHRMHTETSQETVGSRSGTQRTSRKQGHPPPRELPTPPPHIMNPCRAIDVCDSQYMMRNAAQALRPSSVRLSTRDDAAAGGATPCIKPTVVSTHRLPDP